MTVTLTHRAKGDCHFILSLLQILIHPSEDVIEPCYAPVCATDARESMRLFGKAHEFRFHAGAFERDEGLLALFNWAAMVMLVVDDECGSLGFTQIFNGRHIPQPVHAFLRRS